MSRKLISTGSTTEVTAGYSRAVVQGDWCFIAGTTGYDYSTMKIPTNIEDQCANCFNTIDKTLQEAGFERADIVRANYIVTDQKFVDIVFPLLGQYFDGIRPAATMIIADLIKPEIKFEIEVTALKRS
ncbi:RidA family protein [Lentilitoribacter sp. Alg239-R112]|uniref:RidA family protein n=1 Tax=Lentilitoribacter sp. Alg239-R112 TaxID=2305987 RepID=UPI0013A6ACDE|nr:RidA family protein [Lentilitoribacter sp. Alg239-R112]